jgi:hypothetical protein
MGTKNGYAMQAGEKRMEGLVKGYLWGVSFACIGISLMLLISKLYWYDPLISLFVFLMLSFILELFRSRC